MVRTGWLWLMCVVLATVDGGGAAQAADAQAAKDARSSAAPSFSERMPEPTHYATGRANFRGGGTLTFQLLEADRERLLPE